jgi:uncharacterized membrane protein YfcA
VEHFLPLVLAGLLAGTMNEVAGGGAIGLMMMAVWTLIDSAELKAMAPVRTLLVSATNGRQCCASPLLVRCIGRRCWR